MGFFRPTKQRLKRSIREIFGAFFVRKFGPRKKYFVPTSFSRRATLTFSPLSGWLRNRTGTGNRNRRNRFSRNRKRNRNRRNRFPGTETGTVLSCWTVLKHRKPLFAMEPPEPKTGTARTVPPPNRNRTEPNRGLPALLKNRRQNRRLLAIRDRKELGRPLKST